MSILKNIMKAIKGGAREVGEAIVDANGIRIFEQNIAEAKQSLEKAKSSLADVMAKEMQTKRKITNLDNNINEHEGFAKAALGKGNEALALEIAEKIAEYETELNEQQAILASFANNIVALKNQIQKAEKTIAANERELAMVKTTESVQKATISVTDNISANSSKILSAKQSLNRIKQRQQHVSDRLAAGDVLQAELSGSDLEDKMKAAGIGKTTASAQSVLERLK